MVRRVPSTIFFLLVALLWGIIIVLMRPWGDFPLNDDWSFAWSVKRLLDGNGLQLLSNMDKLLYFQVLLGAAASMIFGFSFVTLRFVSLGCALIAFWSLWWLLQQAGVSAKNTFIAVLVLMVNPWFMNLSFTFMTDVPALAFLLLAVALMIRGFKLDKPILIILANLSALGSMFIRQTGALFFLAAIIALTLNIKRKQSKHSLLITLIFIVIAEGIYLWLGHIRLLPQATETHLLNLHELLPHIVLSLKYALLYLGLLLLPILAGVALARWKVFMDGKTIGWLILTGSIVAYFWNKGAYFPYMGNVIVRQGLGPTGDVLQGTESVMFPLWVWQVLSILSAIGAALLLRFLVYTKLSFLKNRRFPFDIVLVGSLAGLQFLLVLVVKGQDRYLLPALAFFIAYIGLYYKNFRINLLATLYIGTIMGIYSFVGTQNYLRWNEVRWSEANTLVAQGIDTSKIEAGYEWCGWQLHVRSLGMEITHNPSKPWYLNHVCQINTAEYVISFSELAGYEVIKKTTYPSLYDTSPWLFVLKKERGI